MGISGINFRNSLYSRNATESFRENLYSRIATESKAELEVVGSGIEPRTLGPDFPVQGTLKSPDFPRTGCLDGVRLTLSQSSEGLVGVASTESSTKTNKFHQAGFPRTFEDYRIEGLFVPSTVIQGIRETFELSDFAALCYEMGVDHENLRGKDLSTKALALAEKCRREFGETVLHETALTFTSENPQGVPSFQRPSKLHLFTKTASDLTESGQGTFRRQLDNCFSYQELQELSKSMGVDPETLNDGTHTRTSLARTLIGHFKRRGGYQNLAEGAVAFARERAAAAPLVSPLPEPTQKAPKLDPPNLIGADGKVDTVGLDDFLQTRFGRDDLRDLCFDLELNHEDLPGDTHQAQARGLVRYFQNRDRLTDLATQAVSQYYGDSQASSVESGSSILDAEQEWFLA